MSLVRLRFNVIDPVRLLILNSLSGSLSEKRKHKLNSSHIPQRVD